MKAKTIPIIMYISKLKQIVKDCKDENYIHLYIYKDSLGNYQYLDYQKFNKDK